METVRDFLKRENGRIELRFTDDPGGSDIRLFQTSSPCRMRFAVHSMGVSRTRKKRCR